MKYQIEKSLELLCDLRNRLDTSLKKKLIIKTYDSDTKHSITVIDGKIIKVEDRPIGSDSKSRPNHLTFKKDNKDFLNDSYANTTALKESSMDVLSYFCLK
jgi:hypothetical protein